MSMPNLLQLSLCFALVGPLAYIVILQRRRQAVDLSCAIECMMNAAGIPGGLFLIICSFVHQKLFKIVNERGQIIQLQTKEIIEVEGEKLLYICVGGFVIVFLSVSNLIRLYSGKTYEVIATSEQAGKPQ